MTISGKPSKTDWDRVRRSIEMDDPIPYDANDPDDGPYDPNDDEAVDRFLTRLMAMGGGGTRTRCIKRSRPSHSGSRRLLRGTGIPPLFTWRFGPEQVRRIDRPAFCVG